MPLVAEPLEVRDMLATVASLSGDLSAFARIRVTFGSRPAEYVGQLSWSGMTGDAAATGLPAAFKSFCIEGQQSISPGRSSFDSLVPLAASTLLGPGRADLVTEFWRHYGPTASTGFTDNTDGAAFQLGIWELINDGRPAAGQAAAALASGGFKVAGTHSAVARAAAWLNGTGASAASGNAVTLYALQSPTKQDQVVCVPVPVVSVQVTPTSVAEDARQPLSYTFTASAPLRSDITVSYTIGGSATAGSDCTGVPAEVHTGSIRIPARSSSASLTITPTADSDIEPDETVVITLQNGIGYVIGPNSIATGTIEDDDFLLDLILDGLPEESAPPPNELSPGAILTVSGDRVSLVADVPAGRTATLSIARGADKVRVYRDATGGVPVLEEGREAMLIIGGSRQYLYAEASGPSLIQGDIHFLLISGTTPALTEIAVATAVRVDLDVDSNNDGTIDPDDGPRGTDDWIEATTSKRLVVNDADADVDGVPDYADWSIDCKRFTPLIIRIPGSLPLASMQLALSYAASHPALSGSDNRLPAESVEQPLRIWTQNAANRRPASVTAGGTFVPSGRLADLSVLGFTESIRTVELYVEGIRTTAGDAQSISIQLFVGDRLTSADLVNVSIVSNVLVIGIDGTDTRSWLTGPDARRSNGRWNSHVRNLIADVEPFAMTIYRYGPDWGMTGADSDDIQRDVVKRANEIIRDAGGGTRVALVGWSRGAMIALWAANELSGSAAQAAGMHRTVDFVGLYDPVDMSTTIPSDERVGGENAARIQPGIARVTIIGPKEDPNNNVDYPVGLPSYWTGVIFTPDPVFVRMAQNNRITALGGTTIVERVEYNASHGAIGGCPGYNVHLVSIPGGNYDYGEDRLSSILSDQNIRNGMRAAGFDCAWHRDEDWYGFPATRPISR